MMNKIMIMSGFIFVFLMGIGLAASSEPSYCCERTTSGAWCVNDVESKCASGYNTAPTSCETTSYCRLGTCYDSDEGICMGNTPERVCLDSGGTWDRRKPEEVAQCQLGCCVIADQAAFVSLVRCKKLSTFFGVENDYRTEITSEIACIAEANAQDIGACVYEKDFDRLCDFTTRGECGADEVVEVADDGSGAIGKSGKKFYKNYLCSAEELGTSCARQTSTSCYQGDVYWMDSCGNRENVYSSNKAKSWNSGRVIDDDGVCPANSGDSDNCGNCDYLLGTRCAAFEGILGGPSYGDYYCQRTECVDRYGNDRINGESWCVKDSGAGDGGDKVGSRYFREVCADGVVRVEPCSDFRNEVCLEGSIQTSKGEFGTAACRVNRWQDCVFQTDKDDCLNIDRRDCKWMPSVLGMILSGGTASGSDAFSNPTVSNEPAFSNPTASPITGNSIFGGGDDEEEGPYTTTNRPNGICVPNFPPGLEFWKEGSAKTICGQASAKCVVSFEKGLLSGGWECVENCECLEEGWARSANNICTALGDCGAYVNYVDEYTDDGVKWVVNGEERFLS
jgi:hypothetical protein